MLRDKILDILNSDQRDIFVVVDQMAVAILSKLVVDFFTKGSNNKYQTVIYLVQNVNNKTKNHKTI